MIIPNGKVKFFIVSEPTRNAEDGIMKPGERLQTGMAECQYIQSQRNDLAKSNGERVTTASYKVLLDEQKLPEITIVTLYDARNKELGTFPLQCPPEHLRAVSQILLTL